MGTQIPAGRDCDTGEDRISGLPGDILMYLVSTMGMKEAAKTSILSKKWRYLSTMGTHLDFNHLIVLPEVNHLYFTPPAKKDKYINWVNQVVDSHCNPWIDTFSVHFCFDSSDAHHIDKWVKFAISKKVKNLELNLISISPVYTLTFDVLKPSLDVNDSGCRFLQSLFINKINVSGDVVEYLLAQCRLLERLHIDCSQMLVRLKVVGSCLKLKHLTILRCDYLEEVDIEAVNLVYLCYSCGNPRPRAVFVSKNIPNLVEARFLGLHVSDFAPFFQQNSHLAQISKICLSMQDCKSSAGSLPTFCNLKQLSIMVRNSFDCQLATIFQFLKACPKLREFKVKFGYWDHSYLEEAYQLKELDSSSDEVETRMIQDWEYFKSTHEMELGREGHPKLKEFQMATFCGCNLDVKLILFLVLTSCNLETIICDCSYRNSAVREVSERRAAKLAKLIPPKISLVIM